MAAGSSSAPMLAPEEAALDATAGDADLAAALSEHEIHVRNAQIEQDAMLAQSLADEEERQPAGTRSRRTVKFRSASGRSSVPTSEFAVDDEPEKPDFASFSSWGGRWHEMQREVCKLTSQELKELSREVRGMINVSHWIVQAMVGKWIPSAPSATEGQHEDGFKGWERFHKGKGIAPEMWDMLGFALAARDHRMLGTVWRFILGREQDLDGVALCLPVSIVAPMIESPLHLLDAVEFLALRARKPRLLLEVLSAETPIGFDYPSIAANLASIAMAIVDAVFAPQRKPDTMEHKFDFASSRESWNKWFVEPEESHRLNDNALYAAGWRAVVLQLLALIGEQLPRKLEQLDNQMVRRSVPLLSVAARASENTTFFMDAVLDHEVGWSPVYLNESIQACLEHNIPRGPNHSKVIGRLYQKLLLHWRNNSLARARQTVVGSDDLARPWNRVLSASSGFENMDEICSEQGLAEGGAVAMLVPSRGNPTSEARHPSEWMAIVEEMVAAHAPDPEDPDSADWDHSSNLFASLMRAAVTSIAGDPSKTYLLAYLVQLSVTHAQNNPLRIYWLSAPRLVYNVAMHHTELLIKILKLMRLDDNGNEMPVPQASYLMSIKNALIDCVNAEAKEPARKLIRALGPGNMPRSLMPDRHNMSSRGNIGFLAFYVMRLGENAGQQTKLKHGADFVQFMNAQVENDFNALLDSENWTDLEKEEALQFCVPQGGAFAGQHTASYNRSICARLLMARGVAPPADNTYLQCIAETIFRPTELGASMAKTSFETNAMMGNAPSSKALGKRPAPPETRDGAEQQRASKKVAWADDEE